MQAVQPSRMRCVPSKSRMSQSGRSQLWHRQSCRCQPQIEEFPAREAPEPLWLAAQMTLHVLDRRDRFSTGNCFPNAFTASKEACSSSGVKSKRRLGAGEIGGRERSQRVGKCDRAKAEIP